MPNAILGVVDQVLSSASNLLIAVVMAHETSPRGFGAFGVAYAVYLTALTLSRGAVGGVAAFRLAARTDGEFREQAANGLVAAVCIGVLSGGITAVVALGLTAHGMQALLLVVAVFLPALLAQDALRYLAFAAHRPWSAIANDTGWLVVQGLLLGLVATGVRPTAVDVLATWGVASLAGVVVGARLLRLRPQWLGARNWLKHHGSAVKSLTLEYALISGVMQGSPVIVGLVAGLPAVGAMRAVQTTFGPVTAMSAGLSLAILPRAARKWSRGTPRAHVDLVLVGGALALLAMAWAGLVLVFPLHAGRLILGANWALGRDLALITAIYLALTFLSFPPTAGLRVMGRNWIATEARAVLAPLMITGVVVGAASDGAYGATAGLAVGSGAGLVLYWGLFVRDRALWADR